MTYAVGALITAAEHNYWMWGDHPSLTLRDVVGFHWGVGGDGPPITGESAIGHYGLGQDTSSLVRVSAGGTINSASWTALVTIMNKILSHEGKALLTLNTAVGDTVAFSSNLDAARLRAVGSSMNTIFGVTYISSNRGTTGLPLTDSSATVFTESLSWGINAGPSALPLTNTITFASANSARYFFNAGGTIKLSFLHNASANAHSIDWANFCAACGTLYYDSKATSKVGGSGSPTTLLNSVALNTTGGFYSTDFPEGANGNAHFAQSFNAYMSISVNVSVNANVITFSTTFTDLTPNSANDNSFSTSIVVGYPSTAYLTNTWGTPTISGESPLAQLIETSDPYWSSVAFVLPFNDATLANNKKSPTPASVGFGGPRIGGYDPYWTYATTGALETIGGYTGMSITPGYVMSISFPAWNMIDYTFEFDVYFRTFGGTPNDPTLFSQSVTGTGWKIWAVNPNGNNTTRQLTVWDGGIENQFFGTVTTGQWYTCRLSYSATDGILRGYLNGNQGFAVTAGSTLSSSMYIGGLSWDFSNYSMDGVLRMVRLTKAQRPVGNYTPKRYLYYV